MSGRYKLSWLCEALMVSRSGYYDWLYRRNHPGPRALENAVLRQRIRSCSSGSGESIEKRSALMFPASASANFG